MQRNGGQRHASSGRSSRHRESANDVDSAGEGGGEEELDDFRNELEDDDEWGANDDNETAEGAVDGRWDMCSPSTSLGRPKLTVNSSIQIMMIIKINSSRQ